MYHNSLVELDEGGIRLYRILFLEYFNADRHKITRDVRDLFVSSESFHGFLRHH